MNIRLSHGLRLSRRVKNGKVLSRSLRISRGELAGKGYIAGEDVGIGAARRAACVAVFARSE